MVPMLETKISSPSAVIKIITDMQSEKNAEYFDDSSKELEKGGREYKESSSTQTSSSSSLLHKRKVHSYYVANGFYKSMSNHNMMVQNRPRRNVNSTTQRIISAKFLRVKQLQSELTEAQKKITDLQEENRTLKNIHKRQDSALRKYESQDSYLPQLLKSHEEETRILTLKYKKLRGTYNDLESRYNKQFTELATIKERYKHLLQISQDKHLLQRERLTRQIEEMKIVINDLKNKIKLQSRRLDLEVKNYKYQLTAEFHKQKSLKDQLKQSQDLVQKLQTALEDKDRIMANCKMNQHVANKVNQSRLNKLPSSTSLQPIRIRSIENGNQECSAVSINKESGHKHVQDKSENTSKPNKLRNMSYDSSDINNDEKDEKLDNDLHLCKSPETTSFSSLHAATTEMKHGFTQILKKSDDNNNTGPELFDSDNPRKSPRDIVKIQNYSIDNFEHYEKSLQDETSSEKSEDFKAADETVSWLELHEKTNQENEIHPETLNKKYEDNSQTAIESKSQNIFQHDNSSLEDDKFSIAVEANALFYSSSRTSQVQSEILPSDKKSALLQALKEIDSEVQGEVALQENNVADRKHTRDSRVRKPKKN